MNYMATDGLCAISFGPLRMQRPDQSLLTETEAVELLLKPPFEFELVHQGFDVNALQPLAELVAQSTYRLRARLSEAPHTFDCSSLTKWFYAQYGVWLPRRSIQQSKLGISVIQENHLWPGDLIFSASKTGRNFYDLDPNMGIGHVGIATGHGTLFHASRVGVTETDISSVIGQHGERLRAVRRLIPNPHDFYVFRPTRDSEIETSDDIYLMIQDHLAS